MFKVDLEVLSAFISTFQSDVLFISIFTHAVFDGWRRSESINISYDIISYDVRSSFPSDSIIIGIQ